MKKYIISIFVLFLGFTQASIAQDDDVYFMPSKSKKEVKEKTPEPANAEYLPNDHLYSHDNWADGRTDNGRDVDEYNRRGKYDTEEEETSTVRQNSENEVETVSCTERIVRFHSPTVGVYVSSPYYADYIDIWFDPWYYDPWYRGYGYYGWHSYYHPWYNPWYDPWYDPWYNPWGPYYGWYYPYYRPSYRPVAPAGAHYGPHGGYVYYGNRNNSGNRHYNNNRYSGRYQQDRPSREYTDRYHNERPSRNYGSNAGNRPSRDFGGTNTSRPSRRFGDNGTTRPNREFSGSSNRTDRNMNTTPSRPRNTGNLGGGRNFGSGNSRGGRR